MPAGDPVSGRVEPVPRIEHTLGHDLQDPDLVE